MAATSFITYAGTAGAAWAEFFFDGVVSFPHDCLSALFLRNDSAVESIRVSLDGQATWVTLAPGQALSVSGLIENSRNSFYAMRDGAVDAAFTGHGVLRRSRLA